MSDIPETRILTMILGNLAALPGCALLMPDGSMRGTPDAHAVFWRMNTGKAKDRAGRMVAFGVPGQADITGAVNGRRVEIEVKAEDGDLSPAQREFQARMARAGVVYIVARSLDDVIPQIRALL